MQIKKQYKYQLIYTTLKKEIENHIYEVGDLLPSEKEIIERFGVDRTTARKGLALLVSEGLVKKEPGVGTRLIGSDFDRQDAIRHQRRIIGFFTMKDGVYANKGEQPYYSDLFYELEHQCRKENCQVMYYTINDLQEFRKAIENNAFLGIIFVSQIPDECVAFAIQRQIPTVLINRYYGEATCVMCNHSKGASLAMEYLIENEHKRIGIIRGLEGYISDEEKFAGCLRTAYEKRITLDRRLILRGNWEFGSGYEMTRKMFSLTSPPTAIFCFNDIMALGAIKALREMNYMVGKEVSVIGFDNMKQLQFSEPDLSTVDCNITWVARLAIYHVIAGANTRMELPGTVLAPVKLIRGKTVGKVTGS